MMIESIIINLLQKKATEIIDKKYPVKYINTNIKVEDNFWEIVYIPNNYEDEFLDSCKSYRGLFRLIFHGLQDNSGIYNYLKEVERVSEGFTKGLKLFDEENNVQVIITDNPNFTGYIEEEGKILLPLTIKYFSFKI